MAEDALTDLLALPDRLHDLDADAITMFPATHEHGPVATGSNRSVNPLICLGHYIENRRSEP